jgi:hypothetical protein
MLPDGSYVREKGGKGTSSQETLYRYFSAYKVKLDEEPAPVPVKTAPTAAQPEAAGKASDSVSVRTASAPSIILQSPSGGEIALDALIARIGEVDTVYVRIDRNKAYWVKGKESGDINIW